MLFLCFNFFPPTHDLTKLFKPFLGDFFSGVVGFNSLLFSASNSSSKCKHIFKIRSSAWTNLSINVPFVSTSIITSSRGRQCFSRPDPANEGRASLVRVPLEVVDAYELFGEWSTLLISSNCFSWINFRTRSDVKEESWVEIN